MILKNLPRNNIILLYMTILIAMPVGKFLARSEGT